MEPLDRSGDERHADLLRARHSKGSEDRFLAFWLRLMTEQRAGSSARRAARAVDEFLSDDALRAATASVGWGVVVAELADAARRYFDSCVSDPRYRASFFGLKVLSDAEVRTKAAGDACDMLAVLVSAGAVRAGHARDLACALLDGALASLPGLEPELASRARRHVGVPELLADLLPGR